MDKKKLELSLFAFLFKKKLQGLDLLRCTENNVKMHTAVFVQENSCNRNVRTGRIDITR